MARGETRAVITRQGDRTRDEERRIPERHSETFQDKRLRPEVSLVFDHENDRLSIKYHDRHSWRLPPHDTDFV
jgi:hypothetical protein